MESIAMAFNNMHVGSMAGLGFVRKSRLAAEVPGEVPPQQAGPSGHVQQPPAYDPQGTKRGDKKWAVAIVAVLVVLAVAFAFSYSSAHGKGWFGSSAEIYIVVNNLNTDDALTATITVNGQEIGERILTNGDDWTVTFKPLFFGDNATFEIKLDVDGSVLSDWEQVETVTVVQGETRNVNFIVL